LSEDNIGLIMKKLDLILIVLLAKSGLSQKEIAKILGISTKKIWEIFGDKFSKVQVTKSND